MTWRSRVSGWPSPTSPRSHSRRARTGPPSRWSCQPRGAGCTSRCQSCIPGISGAPGRSPGRWRQRTDGVRARSTAQTDAPAPCAAVAGPGAPGAGLEEAAPLAAEPGESGAGLAYRVARPLAVPADGASAQDHGRPVRTGRGPRLPRRSCSRRRGIPAGDRHQQLVAAAAPRPGPCLPRRTVHRRDDAGDRGREARSSSCSSGWTTR